VSNGYISPEPLRDLVPYLSAANIDVKSFSDRFYRDICGGRLEPVLNSCRVLLSAGVHLEITNLVIPGLNDSSDDIRKLAEWIASLSDKIPLHLSRYFPNYQMTKPPTPEHTLRTAYDTASGILKHVYAGNISADWGKDTYCAGCQALLIKRSGYDSEIVNMSGSKCGSCGRDSGIIISLTDKA